jgi:hypothetical protein
VVELVVDIFETLATIPETVGALNQHMLPIIIGLLSNNSNPYYSINTAIQCLTILGKTEPDFLSVFSSSSSSSSSSSF